MASFMCSKSETIRRPAKLMLGHPRSRGAISDGSLPCCVRGRLTRRLRQSGRLSSKWLGVTKMDEFDLPKAVDLFSQEKSVINNLWTTFAVATFAAASFGVTVSNWSRITAIAATLGFLAFAFGNWKLLKQSLKVNRALQMDIRRALASNPNNQFRDSIEALVSRANPPWISLMVHLFIDTCVVVALWKGFPSAAYLD